MKNAVSSYGPSPREDPESYPGENPDGSYFLLGSCVLPLRPVPRRRLGQWRIRDLHASEDTSRWRKELGPDCSLNYGLLAANAAGIEERIPVLAIGSNSSPPQLFDKFSHVQARVAIPVVKSDLRGLDVAFSAHVSAPGYIPVSVRAAGSADQWTPVFVTFLDADELSVIDGSEGNYDRVTLCHPDGGPIIRLESGEELWACAAYRTHHGVLDLEPRSDGTLLSQCRVRALVAERLTALGAPTADAGAILGGKGGRALHAIPEIAAAGMVVPDGLEPFIRPIAPTYGGIDSSLQTPSQGDVDEGLRGVLASAAIERRGEPCVALDRTLPENRRVGSHLFAEARWEDLGEGLGMVCRVVDRRDVPAGLMRVDQVVRNAIGVETRETVRIRSCSLPTRLAALLRPRYVVCRVQVADLVTVEQRACALASVAFDLLGIASGDQVVLEGGLVGDKVRTLRLKAIAAPAELLMRRELYGGGGIRSRFPLSRDALAVHPDLPWAFLDRDAREALGLGKLSPVRIRASQAYQVRKETRELMLLLILALVGVVSALRSAVVRWWAIGIVLLLAFAAVMWRLRDRLR